MFTNRGKARLYTLCSNFENAKSQISPNEISCVKVKHGIEKKNQM